MHGFGDLPSAARAGSSGIDLESPAKGLTVW